MNNVDELKSAMPNYDNCLVNLANSVLSKFGAKTIHDTLPMADELLASDYKNVVVLVLDAMGVSILEKHLDKDGFFRSHVAGSFDSVFPPTTVAATTSLMSGLYPDEHGWLGWDIYYPKLEKNVTVFRNIEQKTERQDAKPEVGADGRSTWTKDSLDPDKPAADYHVGFKFTPYKNIVDAINEAGGRAYFSMPFMPPFPQDLEAILSRVEGLCKEPERKFIYAYWSEPDSTMHRTGTVSSETHEMVTSLEKRIEKFAAGLEDTLLLITADHGHMDSDNLCILDYPEVMDCLVRLPSIEPRVLNMFVKEDKKDIFPSIFRKNFPEDLVLLTREEVLSLKLFGTGNDHSDLPDMIGDHVAVATGKTSVFTTHIEAQEMPGGHAGLMSEERIIPLIAVKIK